MIDMIPKRLSNCFSRIHANISMFGTKKEYFQNYFLSSSISQWNELDINIRNADSLASFKSNFLKFIRSVSNSICNIHNLEAVARRCSVKKMFLKISKNSQESTCVRVSFLIKLGSFIKRETVAQVFFCEFLKFLRFPIFPVAASDNPKGIQFLTRDHKFRYNFLDTVNPLCSCSLKIELAVRVFSPLP